MKLLPVAWLALMAAPLMAQSLPMLDGEFASPARTRTTYEFACPHGSNGGDTSYRLIVSRGRSGAIGIDALVGADRKLAAGEIAKLQAAAARFAYIDSVTPRCPAAGGATMLLGGRDGRAASPRLAVMVALSATGIVTIIP